MLSSITMQRLNWGLKWNSGDYDFCLPIIRLYLHASSYCHIVRDEWWPAAAAEYDSSPYTLPHTPVLDQVVIERVERRFSKGSSKLPMSDEIS